MAMGPYQTSSGHYIGNSSISDPPSSSQILEPTAGATQPRTVPCCKVFILLLIHNTKGWWQSLWLWAQYQSSSSGHYIANSSHRLVIDQFSQITESMANFQPIPTPCYKLYVFFLNAYCKRIVSKL